MQRKPPIDQSSIFSEFQHREYDNNEHLNNFQRLLNKMVENFKSEYFPESYSCSATTLPKLFVYGSCKASLSSEEMHRVASGFYSYCKSNRETVYANKVMKNEFVEILNAMKELYLIIAKRIIVAGYNSSDEIKLNKNEIAKLEIISNMMRKLGIEGGADFKNQSLLGAPKK